MSFSFVVFFLYESFLTFDFPFFPFSFFFLKRIAVGITGNAAVCADASNDQIFIKVLVVEVFASVLGIFGLIVGILMISNAQ